MFCFEFSASVWCLCLETAEGGRECISLRNSEDCAVCCRQSLPAEPWRCWWNLGAVCAGSPARSRRELLPKSQRICSQHETGEWIVGRKPESLPVTPKKETCDPGRGDKAEFLYLRFPWAFPWRICWQCRGLRGAADDRVTLNAKHQFADYQRGTKMHSLTFRPAYTVCR